MEKLANRLAQMLVRENLINDSMLDIYEYGLLRMLELGGAVLTSLVICLSMGIIKEGIVFFAFFIPLRSYLGGVHLKKYWQCYIMSCMILIVALTITKFVSLGTYVPCGLIVAASAGIVLEAKFERREQGNRVYALVVWAVVIVLLAMTAICFVRGEQSMLVLLCCVSMIVLVSKVAAHVLQR